MFTTNSMCSKPKTAAQEKTKGAAKGQKATANGAAGATKAAGNKKKTGRAGRPKAKTAEELDAEMQDYFGGNEANGAAASAAAAPAAAPAISDDANMDEIS